MRRFIRPGMTAFLFALALGATAVVSAQSAVILSRKVRPGDQFRYSMNVDFEIESKKAFFATTLTDRVAEVSPEGVARFESTQNNARLIFDNKNVPTQNNSIVTITVVAPTGVVESVTGDLTDSATYRIANMMSFRYPETPIRENDSWTASFEADPKKGTPAAIVTYTFEARDPVAGTESARIRFNYRETEGAQPARNSGMIWIDTTSGMITRMDASWQNAPMPGAPAPVNARVRILLQR